MSIDFEVSDRIARIVINRPEALNSMTQPMYADFSKAWIEVRDSRAEGRYRQFEVPLQRIAVTIKGPRDPEVFHYQSIHMRFELTGVSQAQADDLVRTYQGRCPLYGTVSRASKMTVEVVVVSS